MRVYLECEGPVFAGQKRLHDNVLTSREDIPGSIIRASLARSILKKCPLFRFDEADPLGRYNWVYVRDEEKCAGCLQYEICRSFSDWKIGFLRPEGIEVLSFHDRVCKNNKNHGLHTGNDTRCRICGGRLEGASGWKKDGQIYEFKRIRTTRTAIDKYTGTAQEGTLHSVEAIYDPDILWVFEAENVPEDVFRPGDVLRLGKYTAVGYGHFVVKKTEEGLKEKSLNISGSEISLMLETEALLPQDAFDNEPVSNEEYINKWNGILFRGLKSLKLISLQAETDVYRGYDTTRGWGNSLKEPYLTIEKGSTFTFEIADLSQAEGEILNLLNNGIGHETENGYGRLKIINEGGQICNE